MTSTLERPPAPRKKEEPDWYEYWSQINTLATTGEYDKLEKLLSQEHPVLPAELEAYKELKTHTDHDLSVTLDDSGLHVIKKEPNPEDN